LAGCRTAPKPPPAARVDASNCPKPAARFEGASILFREVVVSVPVEGAHQIYQNLHVGLMAIITPHDSLSGDPAAVPVIAERLEPKVAAEVLKVMTDSPTISPHKLDQVRDNLAAKLKPVVSQSLEALPQAFLYDVEVVIVSMYWTDSTVGRADFGVKTGRNVVE
jgi:CMP-2-keto-3-deoxyoctulosonic acid synthetase